MFIAIVVDRSFMHLLEKTCAFEDEDELWKKHEKIMVGVMYYDAASGKCSKWPFFDGFCVRNKNMFLRRYQCEDACINNK